MQLTSAMTKCLTPSHHTHIHPFQPSTPHPFIPLHSQTQTPAFCPFHNIPHHLLLHIVCVSHCQNHYLFDSKEILSFLVSFICRFFQQVSGSLDIKRDPVTKSVALCKHVQSVCVTLGHSVLQQGHGSGLVHGDAVSIEQASCELDLCLDVFLCGVLFQFCDRLSLRSLFFAGMMFERMDTFEMRDEEKGGGKSVTKRIQ